MIDIIFYIFICGMWFYIFKNIEKQKTTIKVLINLVELSLIMLIFLYMHYKQYLPEIISLCNIFIHMIIIMTIAPRKAVKQMIKIREQSR